MEKKNRSDLRIVVEDIMKPLLESYCLSHLQIRRVHLKEVGDKFFVEGRINHMSGFRFAQLLDREESFFVSDNKLTYIINA